jgi:class 3 adenylate cyclase
MVTLVFTDVDGSIRLWEADREAMVEASARHNRIVREQVHAAGGSGSRIRVAPSGWSR